MLNKIITLQLVAEDCGAVEGETPGETAPAAGEQQDFESLIRGPYKEAFDQRVQKILDGRLRALRRENQALRRQTEQRQQTARAAFAELERRAGEVKAVYADFDWQREVENREFAGLIAAGVEPRTAYEVVHRQEILRAAMACAAARAADHAVRSAAAGVRRAAENGGRSTAVSRPDPRSLTAGQLADIRRRVMDGEKIRF